MPVKHIVRTAPAQRHYKEISYESQAASWLVSDGWEVFLPMIDHDMKTDLLVADKHNFYRIQVKFLDTNQEDVIVENKWGSADLDYIIYFSRRSPWGYLARPFQQKRKRLNSKDHIRFHQDRKPFLKAFEQI
ncbi:group I intron-associated PD-(D/E)XK endonuclease [Endozoicomonas sp. GU-1]|uniref:group I intron-associated PD-(D/E)XK endonuclease n=1 Tax=Endozoicomonas sp. GU-1 TaxID=3009078 RepID=UPI0022B3A131|nr:group I intron-associated PD-(D/E)XK endonuclease [Endozoicomonas sp. GU-1]WBA82375.1 group I intron-associated PD-(D/E)XK endonuclease [Endozoicomonas sp. GU-1]WBA85312.1 group I intron-associated PD-(D/E)XK endonuclease [Endozoicomonas sp. GU-1]